MAARFRLVKYDNLPRFLSLQNPGGRGFFLVEEQLFQHVRYLGDFTHHLGISALEDDLKQFLEDPMG